MWQSCNFVVMWPLVVVIYCLQRVDLKALIIWFVAFGLIHRLYIEMDIMTTPQKSSQNIWIAPQWLGVGRVYGRDLDTMAPAARSRLCRLGLQMMSLPQDGGAGIRDISASFLYSERKWRHDRQSVGVSFVSLQRLYQCSTHPALHYW